MITGKTKDSFIELIASEGLGSQACDIASIFLVKGGFCYTTFTL